MSFVIVFLHFLAQLIIYILHLPFLQPVPPIRVETQIKLGGTQCNMMINRLKPWLVLHSPKKKKMVLGEEASKVVKPQSTNVKTIVWTCKFSAPDITMMVFSMAGSPVLRVRIVIHAHTQM